MAAIDTALDITNPDDRRAAMERFAEYYFQQGGNMTKAAAMYAARTGEEFQTVRRRFYHWKTRDESFRIMLQREDERVAEEANALILDIIKSPRFREDTRLKAAMFLLERKGQHLGYGPPDHNVNVNQTGEVHLHLVPASMVHGSTTE